MPKSGCLCFRKVICMHGGLSPELQHFDQARRLAASGKCPHPLEVSQKRDFFFFSWCGWPNNPKKQPFLGAKGILRTSRLSGRRSPISDACRQIRKIVRPTDVPDSGLVCDLRGPQKPPAMGHSLCRAILGRMNTHVPPILMFTRGLLGFDPQPNERRKSREKTAQLRALR